MSRKAANIISAQVIMKPNCVLGLATGGTPVGAYAQLVEWYNKGDLDFSEVTTVNLDEYRGLPKEHPESYWSFMHKNLFDHVNIRPEAVHLPDGTSVTLNHYSSLSYPERFKSDNREVELSGEAYFEVAKDKDKPFIVKTKEQSIEALGTKFNVSAYPTDSLLTTTLLEGSVLLTTQNLLHPMVLKPNEQFVYNKRTRSALLQQVDANRFVSWTTGYYYFPEQSLEAILYRLSHVYGVQFTVKSEALKRRTFTGTFYRGQSIKDIMEIIHLSIPVRYKIDDHHVTISEI